MLRTRKGSYDFWKTDCPPDDDEERDAPAAAEDDFDPAYDFVPSPP